MGNYCEWRQIGVVGVDSGQLMVCDPCYVGDELPSYEELCEKDDNDGSTKQVRFKRGHVGAGVVFSSGFGDGVYPVMAKFEDCGEWGTRITEVRILMGDEEEEEVLDGDDEGQVD